MANGATRVVLAKAQLEKASYSEINAKFKNENEEVKNTKKFPSRSAIEHNHSSDNLRAKK